MNRFLILLDLFADAWILIREDDFVQIKSKLAHDLNKWQQLLVAVEWPASGIYVEVLIDFRLPEVLQLVAWVSQLDVVVVGIEDERIRIKYSFLRLAKDVLDHELFLVSHNSWSAGIDCSITGRLWLSFVSANNIKFCLKLLKDRFYLSLKIHLPLRVVDILEVTSV